jgi:hypothetical protein
MKNILIVFLVVCPMFLFGQVSPYQRTQIKTSVYYANKYHLSYKMLLSIVEVNTDGGRNGFAKINNPFKIKCFSNSCKKGHCANVDKKNHKEFYRIYSNVWDSYDSYCKIKTQKINM